MKPHASAPEKRSAGIRLARPPVLPDNVVRRIVDAYASGKGLI